jgi:predicted RNA-binding protein YlqC (UPF0109 family)
MNPFRKTQQTTSNSSKQESKMELTIEEQKIKSALETLLGFFGAETAKVELVENEFHRKILEVWAEPEDRGKIMGHEAHNKNAMHTIINALSHRLGVRTPSIHLNDE